MTDYAFWTAPSAEDERRKEREFNALPIAEKLRRRADAKRRQADQFKGCSWMGTHPPGYYLEQEARELEAAAAEIERGSSKG
jgi:hypothetical protein